MRPDLTEEQAHAHIERLRTEAKVARALRLRPRRQWRSHVARLLVRIAVRLEPDPARASRPVRHGLRLP